jgi:hypothetical protein
MIKCLIIESTGFVSSRLLGLLDTIECDIELLDRPEVNNYK